MLYICMHFIMEIRSFFFFLQYFNFYLSLNFYNWMILNLRNILHVCKRGKTNKLNWKWIKFVLKFLDFTLYIYLIRDWILPNTYFILKFVKIISIFLSFLDLYIFLCRDCKIYFCYLLFGWCCYLPFNFSWCEFPYSINCSVLHHQP